MSEMNMNKNNNNNMITGVRENSYMHKCYLGCMAKINNRDIIDFLQGFIKGLNGEVGMIYNQDPETKEIQGLLAIPYKINSQQRQQQNTNGMIPIPGLNGARNGKINEQVLKSIDKIKLQGYGPSLLYKEDAILFRIDFAALAVEMMNPEKGYAVSIDEITLHGQSNIECVVSVFKSRNAGNENRMTRVLQGQKFNTRPQQNQQQGGQRYNGGRR